MNAESTYLLHLLRCFVQREKPKPFDGDWKKLIELSDIHSVAGIVGYLVMETPELCPQPVQTRLKKACLSTIAIQTRRAAAMERLIEKMNEQKLDHLLFKGYIVKDYYRLPELRTYGDIDFLIRKEDRRTSDALMTALEYERKTDWEPVFSYEKKEEYYEIHTDVMEVNVSEKADYRGYFSHIWDGALLHDGHTYELIPEYHLLYLLTHIAKHIHSYGAGIRMYLDIAAFLQHFDGKLNRDYLRDELEKLGFQDFANMVFTLVEQCFGVESPLPLRNVEPAVLEDFLEYTIAGGVFGFEGRNQGAVYLKKESRDGEELSRSAALMHRLFPSAQRLEKRYTYLQGKPWLLPFAWAHRLVKTRDKLEQHARQAKEIMTADEEEVRKLRRIYEEIGL